MSEENTTEQTQQTAENQNDQASSEKEQTPTGTAAVALNSFMGVKAGMTRIFDENGTQIPVTVVKLIPNYITQVKTTEKDGYTAYQVGYYSKRETLVSKPKKGHLKKANVSEFLDRFQEVRVDDANVDSLGAQVDITGFEANTSVDITGTSKGKGFQGVIKRHGFSRGPMAHGSKFHRTGGSIGNCATPAKVFKGKKMPGHMGDKKTTVQNLTVVEMNQDKGYMLIKGSVPGSKNGFIRISKSIKQG